MNQDTQDAPVGRRTGLFVRRGTFVCLGLALILNLIGLALGLSDDGFGWAFEMPGILMSGLAAMVVSLAGLIMAILRLMQQRGRDVAAWCALAAVLITGFGGFVLAAIALAASASV